MSENTCLKLVVSASCMGHRPVLLASSPLLTAGPRIRGVNVKVPECTGDP